MNAADTETMRRLAALAPADRDRLAALAELVFEVEEGPPTEAARGALAVFQDAALEVGALGTNVATVLGKMGATVEELAAAAPENASSEWLTQAARLILIDTAYLAAHVVTGRGMPATSIATDIAMAQTNDATVTELARGTIPSDSLVWVAATISVVEQRTNPIAYPRDALDDLDFRNTDGAVEVRRSFDRILDVEWPPLSAVMTLRQRFRRIRDERPIQYGSPQVTRTGELAARRSLPRANLVTRRNTWAIMVAGLPGRAVSWSAQTEVTTTLTKGQLGPPRWWGASRRPREFTLEEIRGYTRVR